jgi:hypothetical protein
MTGKGAFPHVAPEASDLLTALANHAVAPEASNERGRWVRIRAVAPWAATAVDPLVGTLGGPEAVRCRANTRHRGHDLLSSARVMIPSSSARLTSSLLVRAGRPALAYFARTRAM